MNRLYHIVTNILNNKINLMKAQPMIQDLIISSVYLVVHPPMYPLTVINFSITGGNKNRVKNHSGIMCLWDSRDTNIMIKSGFKVLFCMSKFSRSKIISHQFHVYNNKD